MNRLHPVFSVVKLLPAPVDPILGHHTKCPPPPVVVGNDVRYEVESILDSCLQRGKLQFLIAWKGYGYEENSWENEGDIDLPHLVRQFYNEHPNAPRCVSAIRFATFHFHPTHPSCYSAHQDAAIWRGGDVRGTSLKNLTNTLRYSLNTIPDTSNICNCLRDSRNLACTSKPSENLAHTLDYIR